jgi:glutathione S-transferase
MGAHFTVADCYLFNVTNWGRLVGVDVKPLANLVAYRARISARPAVVAAMKAEGLIR